MENKHSACKVCGGKGGWEKKDETSWPSKQWQDCHYCEGFGFVPYEEDTQVKSLLLEYNRYKKIITDIFDSSGEVLSYRTHDMGRTIDIEYMPKVSKKFDSFVIDVLKYGHYNQFLQIEVSRVIYYDKSIEKLNYYWRISLRPSELVDLDGFINFIRQWR